MRAAGFPPISTVAEPLAMVSGGPVQVQLLVAVAAGIPPMSTVGVPGGKIGPPTCGTVPLTIGQTCISPTLAAGGIIQRFCLVNFYQPAFNRRHGGAGQLGLHALGFEAYLSFELDVQRFRFKIAAFGFDFHSI